MSSSTAIENTYTNPAYTVNPKSDPASLDKNGFLKMLTEQMKNQDPTSGQDPTQYFQTISQMTTVEQLTNLATASTAALSRQKDANATGLIGKTVTYPGADGTPVSGVVQSVQLSDLKGPSLTVAGVAGIDPDAVINVQ
jgi:flagellar basal-body rod modification protein FlgD